MKKFILSSVLLLSYLFAFGQFEDGFIKVYKGLWTNNVVEMDDTTYVFDVRRDFQNELKGIRIFRINNEGVLLDSLSILNKFYSPFPGWRGAMVKTDSNQVISFVRDNIQINPIIRESYFIKWQIQPNLDTIFVKQFFPDSSNSRWEGFQCTKILQLNDGNILIAGFLHQPTPWTNQGYIAKLTPNLDIIWEAVLEEPDLKMRAIDDIIPKGDGTFFISGTSRNRGGGTDKLEYVARVDSTGSIIWEHFFPTYVQRPPNSNWTVQGGQPYIALAQDSNVAVMYSRVLDCGPNGFWCQRRWWKGDYRFVKFDWNGNILIDKLIGSPDVEQNGASSLEAVPSGGFVFSACIFLPGYIPVVLRVSEQGDSLWWREPYFEDARREGGDIIVPETVIPTLDNGFIGVGTATLPTFRNKPSDPAQFAFAFRLDSNGCYGPNHCHESWLSVEELPSPESGLSIYPNPAVNEVNVKLENVSGTYEVLLRDMQGREVRRMRMEETTAQERHVLLPIQGLPSGMYTIEVIGEVRHVVKVRVQ